MKRFLPIILIVVACGKQTNSSKTELSNDSLQKPVFVKRAFKMDRKSSGSFFVEIDSSAQENNIILKHIHEGDTFDIFYDKNSNQERESNSSSYFEDKNYIIESFNIWSIVGPRKVIIQNIETEEFYISEWFDYCACEDKIQWQTLNLDNLSVNVKSIDSSYGTYSIKLEQIWSPDNAKTYYADDK